MHSNSYRNLVSCFQSHKVGNGKKLGKECILVKSNTGASVDPLNIGATDDLKSFFPLEDTFILTSAKAMQYMRFYLYIFFTERRKNNLFVF